MRLLALAYKVKLNFKLQLLTWNRRLDWDGVENTNENIGLRWFAKQIYCYKSYRMIRGKWPHWNTERNIPVKQQNNLFQDFVWLTKCHKVTFLNPEPSFCQISNPFSFKWTDALSNESTRFFLNTFFPSLTEVELGKF